MSLYAHGTVQVTEPARIAYEGAKWSRIEFKAVSIDPDHKICQKHSYLVEMILPTESKTFAEQLMPGTYCAIYMAKVESPHDKNFTKIVINHKHFEILNITPDKES